MIKGHTTIELTNVKTGEVERVEDDNMFTQAIPKIVNFCMTHPGTDTGIYDFFSNQYWKQMLGGILLFDTPVDESAIYASGKNKMVGCGAVEVANSNANILEMGTYNTSESDTSDPLSKKFVYDFTTSQANGTISSVCLTSFNGGFSGYGEKNYIENKSNSGYYYLAFVMQNTSDITTNYDGKAIGTVNSNYVQFCIDSDEDIIYSFSVTNDKLKIATHKCTPNTFDVFRSMSSFIKTTIEEYDLSFSGGSYFMHFYNTDEQALYFWPTNSNKNDGRDDTFIQKGASVNIYRFDMEKKEVKLHCVFQNKYGDKIHKYMAFTDKFAYTSTIGEKFVRIDLSDMSTYIYDKASIYYDHSNCYYVINGILYASGAVYGTSSGSGSNILIRIDNNEFLYIRTVSNIGYDRSIIPPYKNSQIVFMGPVSGFNYSNIAGSMFVGSETINTKRCNTVCPSNYLATINNLGSPVTKTADKTMKITYTITAEE